jgi:hypothetical protein
LSTTNPAAAVPLVPATTIVAVGHPAGADMELALTARLRRPVDAGRTIPFAPRAGEVMLLVFAPAGDGFTAVGQGPACAITTCCVLPIALAGAL